MGPQGANTGDLIRAAVEVGADTALLDEAWWCPGVEMPDGSGAFMVGVRGGILVDTSVTGTSTNHCPTTSSVGP